MVEENIGTLATKFYELCATLPQHDAENQMRGYMGKLIIKHEPKEVTVSELYTKFCGYDALSLVDSLIEQYPKGLKIVENNKAKQLIKEVDDATKES